MLSTLLLASFAALATPQGGFPDVAVFILDDVARADVDGLPTPALDALAARGVDFRRGYAHAWCSPTRDSMYRSAWAGTYRGDLCTGYDPMWTLDDGTSTLAKVLDGFGYGTYVVGKWHQGVASTSGVDWTAAPHLYGFDHWRAGAATSTASAACVPGPVGPGKRVDDGVLSTDQRHRTIQQRDAFLNAFWEAKSEGEPFFGVLAFTDAHSPWELPPAEILPAGYAAPANPSDRDLYEAEVLSLDVVVGEIVAALPPDVWIVLIGDNGTPEPVAPDPTRAKLTTYERGVHVPFLFAGPKLSPRVVEEPVHVVDIAPTLLASIGLPRPSWVEGSSLSPLLVGNAARRSFAFCWNKGQDDRTVIEQRWKLRRVAGVEQLFDLQADPDEAYPLPPIGAEALRLRRILNRLP